MRYLSQLIAVGVFAVTAVLAKKSAGCGKTPALTDEAQKIDSPRAEREFYVRIPENYDKDTPYSLIFLFHGLSASAEQVMAGEGGYQPWFGLAAHASETAVFVVPNGLNRGWANTYGEDVDVIRRIMELVEDELCIETEQRFATGFSYGCGMTYALACAMASEFRAVSCLSGGEVSGCDGGEDPIAYMHIHGTEDNFLAFYVGEEARDRFLENNGCEVPAEQPPSPEAGKHVKTEYECDKGYPVTWITFKGDNTPQPMDEGTDDSFADDETWDFFSQFIDSVK